MVRISSRASCAARSGPTPDSVVTGWARGGIGCLGVAAVIRQHHTSCNSEIRSPKSDWLTFQTP